MAERGGRGEGPQVAESCPGRVFEDRHARRRRLAVREEGPQAGEDRFVQRREAGGRQPGHLSHRQHEVVDRHGELGEVEAAVVVGHHVVGRDQRVLGGRVDLDREDLFERVRRVVRGPVDLWEAAEAVRVLDPPVGRRGAVGGAEQSPHLFRDRLRAGVGPCLVHGQRVRLVRTVDRHQGQRRHHLRGRDQAAQFVQGECGLAEGERVAADQGEGVVVVERLRFGRGPMSLPGVFARQRQAHLRERGDVSGADRTECVDLRVGARLQGFAEGGDDGRA